MNNYKNLFEGKFLTTHNYNNMSLIERFYFNFSPTTIVLKRMLTLLSYYTRGKNKKVKILDVGCGGGIHDLMKYGTVYGIDISASSIEKAKKIYTRAYVADLTQTFPFKDEYFDIVFCSEVYGHISLKDKEKFMGEIYRTLKKNGNFIFSCETKGDNWLTNYLRRKNLYKKKWIDLAGHIGLETPLQTIKRFKAQYRNVHMELNNTYIFTIDELMTIFPIFAAIFKFSVVRRLGNILLFPIYLVSLRFTKIGAANDILVYGNK